MAWNAFFNADMKILGFIANRNDMNEEVCGRNLCSSIVLASGGQWQALALKTLLFRGEDY